jgi:hypothetical protein
MEQATGHSRHKGGAAHGVKVSAIEAALLTGRNERRIRSWIATRRLPAVKVGQSWQIDTDDLERIPGIRINREQLALLQSQEGGRFQNLLSRLSELECTLTRLTADMAALNARVEALERISLRLGPGERQPRIGEPASELETAAAPGSETLPPGSMRVKHFALAHKVHAAILLYQIETEKITDTTVSMANGRRSHWLTPAQQRAVIDFWRRNGTSFITCPRCPHR